MVRTGGNEFGAGAECGTTSSSASPRTALAGLPGLPAQRVRVVDGGGDQSGGVHLSGEPANGDRHPGRAQLSGVAPVLVPHRIALG
jgi:hypothetical protein